MCGVLAVVGWGTAVEASQAQRALEAMAPRGPDGLGLWQTADRRVLLGHVRLAVRDLQGGAQPLTNEDGRIAAAVNGELYATEALRSELEQRGHRFRARTDSELIVHAWEEWGPAMLPRLRGEFAFVLWDERDRVLFAARDRFGIKPLAWAEHQGRLLIASKARALFALGVPAAWDHAALFQSASLQYPPPDTTLFAHVHELAAGHALLARDGLVRLSRYWDLDYPTVPDEVPDEREAIRALRTHFDDAVRVRLEAEVPVAIQLSGGLDSSAVLASATQASSAPLDAFTVSFADDEAYDELHLATETARHLGARLHVVRITDREIADTFGDAILLAEGASTNAHAAAKLVLSRAVRDAGFKVVLTGEGADEVLFGYAHLRADHDGSLARVQGTNTAQAGLMLPDAEGIPTTEVERVLGYVPTWIAAKAAFGKRVRGLARDEWLADFGDRDAGRTLLSSFDVPGQLSGRGRVEQSAYLWTRLGMESHILRTLGDGMEMASSIEGRLPLLDHQLFAFLRRLPTRLKIKDGVEKWIFREAMRDRLLPGVRTREKHPFLAPPMGPLTFAAARDVFGSASFKAQPLFDPGKVQGLLDRWPTLSPTERKVYDPVLFFTLSIASLQARLRLSS